MSKIANEITVSGTVQGVGFRYQTQKAALEMNINGYVKNERDGSVFIFAEAEKANMVTFIHWCKKGPLYARISKINVVNTKPEGHLSFEIRRT
jgi:acylphosphatase